MEISLVGAVLPILFSVFLVVYFRKRLHWSRAGVFALASFAIITGIGSTFGAIFGGLGTPGWAFILFWLFIVTLYSGLKVVKEQVFLVMGELYVIGTFGVLSEDVARTFLGFLNVPVIGLNITPDIWGGAGPMDGIFMTGMYQAILYLLMAVFLSRKDRAANTLPDPS